MSDGPLCWKQLNLQHAHQNKAIKGMGKRRLLAKEGTYRTPVKLEKHASPANQKSCLDLPGVAGIVNHHYSNSYCWWFRNSAITTWDVWKLVNTGINYVPSYQLVNAGFLNHQSTVFSNFAIPDIWRSPNLPLGYPTEQGMVSHQLYPHPTSLGWFTR